MPDDSIRRPGDHPDMNGLDADVLPVLVAAVEDAHDETDADHTGRFGGVPTPDVSAQFPDGSRFNDPREAARALRAAHDRGLVRRAVSVTDGQPVERWRPPTARAGVFF